MVDRSKVGIQSAVNQLMAVGLDERRKAIARLAVAVLEYHNIEAEQHETVNLFSQELPQSVQRTAALQLARILADKADALSFDDGERWTASLFDRTFGGDIYKTARVEARMQTFEKLPAISEYVRSVIDDARILIHEFQDIERLNHYESQLLGLFNGRKTRPVLQGLLPRALISNNRVAELFKTLREYSDHADRDPIDKRDEVLAACDDYSREATAFGTKDAEDILAALASRLRSIVTHHFNTLEASKSPRLTFSAVDKKYPLDRAGTKIAFKIRIENQGVGPARDLRIDEIDSDDSLRVETSSTSLGTLQSNESTVRDILGTVKVPSGGIELAVMFSWAKPGGRDVDIRTFTVEAQRSNVDWDEIEFQEPYSLDAVEGKDLIGREDEFKRLVRQANSKTVSSGYIFGQKRVGKTSLANAVAETLEGLSTDWVVIRTESGAYLGNDVDSTVRALGNLLVEAMKGRIPSLGEVPTPDFSDGLAPLSGFIDKALDRKKTLRILFILDEFDEMPIELARRTEESASLFLPIRQISGKAGCGFLLVGGENMQQIMNNQGDRLNKFNSTRIDYFDKSSNWSDFAELIRRPVEHWLTVSEEALEELYECTAGNPYFAKLLAGQLATHMLENRDSHASISDVRTAITRALKSTVNQNSFAHFWLDGIQDSDSAEQIGIVRRSVLIATGRALSKSAPTNYENIANEASGLTEIAGGEIQFEHAFFDLVRRDIIREDANGDFDTKVPLFAWWLIDRGVTGLLEDVRERGYLTAALQDEERVRVKDDEILRVCETLGHYQGKSLQVEVIRRWLKQFDSAADQRLMFAMLSGMRMYSEDRVRQKMNEAFRIVRRNILSNVGTGSRVRRDILVSHLEDSVAKSGPSYCRLFVSENNIATSAAVPLESVEKELHNRPTVQRLVIIDDFSGTGRSLISGLRKRLEILQSANAKGVRIVVMALVGFGEARDRIESFIDRNQLDADVVFCDELGEEDRAFSDVSRTFTDPVERKRAKAVAEAKGIGIERRQPLGFENTEALIVFYQSCPNNTLPIFWSKNNDWKPVFPRT